MAKGSGGGGRGGISFPAMSNKQLVNYARRQGVVNVGQFSKSQAAALNRAVRAGKLIRGVDTLWGSNRRYFALPGM